MAGSNLSHVTGSFQWNAQLNALESGAPGRLFRPSSLQEMARYRGGGEEKMVKERRAAKRREEAGGNAAAA